MKRKFEGREAEKEKWGEKATTANLNGVQVISMQCFPHGRRLDTHEECLSLWQRAEHAKWTILIIIFYTQNTATKVFLVI